MKTNKFFMTVIMLFALIAFSNNSFAQTAAEEVTKYSEYVNGYDKEGYDKDGYNKNGYDRNGFDRNGYDIKGYNKAGKTKEEVSGNSTSTGDGNTEGAINYGKKNSDNGNHYGWDKDKKPSQKKAKSKVKSKSK
jgi:hypothetical protein